MYILIKYGINENPLKIGKLLNNSYPKIKDKWIKVFKPINLTPVIGKILESTIQKTLRHIRETQVDPPSKIFFRKRISILII